MANIEMCDQRDSKGDYECPTCEQSVGPGEACACQPRQQCPICQGFLPDERNGGEFACPKCGTEFSL